MKPVYLFCMAFVVLLVLSLVSIGLKLWSAVLIALTVIIFVILLFNEILEAAKLIVAAIEASKKP